MKKTLSLLICVILLFCCGCSRKEPVEGTFSKPNSGNKTVNISLAYCDNDYTNPYTCITKVNRLLSSLIYEPLFAVDDKYEAVNILASDIKQNEKNVTVKIKENVMFSDGSILKSQDVLYSFNLAKSEDYIHSKELEEIVSAQVVDEYTIEFTVNKLDPLVANLLTFPIIKAESDKVESGDKILYDPIGTGRYFRDGMTLNANEKYRLNDIKLKKITLLNTPDTEALEHSISAGRISVYYSDMSDGTIPQMLGKSVNTQLPSLIYVGVNYNRSALNAEIREILSGAINRSVICDKVFVSVAEPAIGLYPSGFKEVTGLQTILPVSNDDNVLAKLEELGYNNQDEEGYRLQTNGNVLSFELLINGDNPQKVALANELKEQLKLFGIKLDIVSRNYESYLSKLRSGDFQLYLGEVLFKDNLDPSELLVNGGSAAWGVAPKPAPAPEKVEDASQPDEDESAETPQPQQDFYSGSTQEKIVKFYNGDALFSDILLGFTSELPVIPVCYRNGWLGYCSNIPEGVLEPWASNPYNGIWNIN